MLHSSERPYTSSPEIDWKQTAPNFDERNDELQNEILILQQELNEVQPKYDKLQNEILILQQEILSYKQKIDELSCSLVLCLLIFSLLILYLIHQYFCQSSQHL